MCKGNPFPDPEPIPATTDFWNWNRFFNILIPLNRYWFLNPLIIGTGTGNRFVDSPIPGTNPISGIINGPEPSATNVPATGDNSQN